jgi:hypothetical protein
MLLSSLNAIIAQEAPHPSSTGLPNSGSGLVAVAVILLGQTVKQGLLRVGRMLLVLRKFGGERVGNGSVVVERGQEGGGGLLTLPILKVTLWIC